jgi:hypothetical protein
MVHLRQVFQHKCTRWYCYFGNLFEFPKSCIYSHVLVVIHMLARKVSGRRKNNDLSIPTSKFSLDKPYKKPMPMLSARKTTRSTVMIVLRTKSFLCFCDLILLKATSQTPRIPRAKGTTLVATAAMRHRILSTFVGKLKFQAMRWTIPKSIPPKTVPAHPSYPPPSTSALSARLRGRACSGIEYR